LEEGWLLLVLPEWSLVLSGLLLAFVRMDGTRPGSVELATEGLTALRGGAPVMIRGACVGAVGAGLNKDEDAAIVATVASGLDGAS
jgi:uncharacterized protein GlcG (DUF336 family)